MAFVTVITYLLAGIDRVAGGRLARSLLPGHYDRPIWSKVLGPTVTTVLIWLFKFSGGRNGTSPLDDLIRQDNLSPEVIHVFLCHLTQRSKVIQAS